MKSKLFRTAVCAIAVVAIMGATALTQDSATAAALADIEQRLASSILTGDRTAYEQVLSDDWSVINTDGQILGKAQVVRELFVTGDRRLETIKVDDIRVQSFGDFAVVTGRTAATGTFKGTRASVTLRFTDVFVRRGGRWQIVASQGTLVP